MACPIQPGPSWATCPGDTASSTGGINAASSNPSPTVAGTTPRSAACTSGTCSMREYIAVSRIVIAALGSSSPASAAATPTAPETCEPIKITSPRILMPGAIWQMPQ